MFGKEDHRLPEHTAGAKVSRFLAQGAFRDMQAEIGKPRNCHFWRHGAIKDVVRRFHRAHGFSSPAVGSDSLRARAGGFRQPSLHG